jgi:branched-chain amino acid transport system permease protein
VPFSVTKWISLALVAGAALFPLVTPSPFFVHMGILVLLAVGLATSLNLIAGYAGQVSFATGAFYGIGAYTAGILAYRLHTGFWVNLVAGAVMAGVIGFMLGLPSLRLKGYYLGICTIGFQEGLVIVLLQWGDLTRGPMGITDIPKPSLPGIDFGMLFPNYYLALILAILCVLLVYRLSISGLGLQMMAVREDETPARAVGVNTTFVKLTAFTVSSAMAGALGAFYAHYIGSIDPSVFTIAMSATVLVMVLAGGWGTLLGPVLGAIVLTLMPEWLRAFQDYRMTIYGAALILIILFMPQGLLGVLSGLSRTAAKGTNGKGESHAA